MVPQKPPIRVDAPDATPANASTLIFLHGYGDDGDGWTNIAEQFHSGGKMTHLSFIFPTAHIDQESMATAWFAIDSFNIRGKDSVWEESYDRNGMLKSMKYICGLIDAEVERGIPLNRIILGGFSQGAVISFLVGLGSQHAGRLAGVVGLSGSMPPSDLIEWAQELTKSNGGTEDGAMRIFIAHGTRDQVIPIKAFITSVESIENSLWGMSGGKERLDPHVYEGLGHESSGRELMDICKFLGKVVPA